jgi:hypothetical protein
MTTPLNRDEIVELMAEAVKASFGKQMNATPIHPDPDVTDWTATGGVIDLGDVANAILRALEARGCQIVQGWLPIESAPKDGTEILLWPAIRRPVERQVPSAVGRWSKYRELECWDDLAVGHHNGFWKPTHWQPLPPPPAGKVQP